VDRAIWGLNPGRCKRFFCVPKCPHWLWGLSSFLFSGYWGAVFLTVKQLGFDANHLPPSSDEVKYDGNYTSSPPICLPGMHRDNFF
jgi:hypothetical protein